jgi:hypothetical protein
MTYAAPPLADKPVLDGLLEFARALQGRVTFGLLEAWDFFVALRGTAIFLKAQGDYKKSALSDKAHTTVLHATGLGSSQVEVLSYLTIKVGVQGRMTTSLKSLRYPLMKMILLLTLSLLSVSPRSPPGISRTPSSTT